MQNQQSLPFLASPAKAICIVQQCKQKKQRKIMSCLLSFTLSQICKCSLPLQINWDAILNHFPPTDLHGGPLSNDPPVCAQAIRSLLALMMGIAYF